MFKPLSHLFKSSDVSLKNHILPRVKHFAQSEDLFLKEAQKRMSNLSLDEKACLSFDFDVSNYTNVDLAKGFRKIQENLLQIKGLKKVSINPKGEVKKDQTSDSQKTQACARIKNIIAVASGKGGVGKSTSSLCYAQHLKQEGYKVGLLDADIYGPSLELLVSQKAEPILKGDEVVPSEVEGIKMMSVSFLKKSQNVNIMRGPMAANLVKQFLTQIFWGDLDYLIIDYPPGTGDIQLSISQAVSLTGAIIVTSPQELALEDARKAILMFNALNVEVLGVVETMSYFSCSSCDHKHFIFGEGGGHKIATEFGLSLLGNIPLSSSITNSGDQGNLLQNFASTDSLSTTFNKIHKQVELSIEKTRLKEQNSLGNFSLKWQKG